MKIEKTYTATIFCGLQRRHDGALHSIDEARSILTGYVDEVGLCVTLTPTEYIYTSGGESGVAVGLINYPRFPSSKKEIQDRALEIARRLMVGLEQMRVSIVFPDETWMLSSESAAAELSGE